MWHPQSSYDAGDLARVCEDIGVLYDPRGELDPDAVYIRIVRPGVVALPSSFKGEMAKLVLSQNFELLAEVARLAREDAPVALATSDPALYTSWRAAVTRYHVAGWTLMTPERVAEVGASVARDAGAAPSSAGQLEEIARADDPGGAVPPSSQR